MTAQQAESAETAAPRRSEARDRLLRTAGELFYAKGIHAVGIDEIVASAQVTRATLYRHFPGKEDLVLAYLTGFSELERAQVEAILTEDRSPVDAVRGLAEAVVGAIGSTGFRGCAFLNAAAEHPGPDQRVHRAVLAHRAWYAETVTEAIRRARPENADEAGRLFVMLRDGAMAAGCLDQPDAVAATFRDGVERLVTEPV